MRERAVAVGVLMACLYGVTGTQGQGTRVNFERSKSLDKLTANKVFKVKVQANWFSEGSQFWYVNQLKGGKQEFILVDAVAGRRSPAFDHARLAEALGKVTNSKIDPERLPFNKISFEGRTSLVFNSNNKSWRCDLNSYELRERSTAGLSPLSLSVNEEIRPSIRTGPASSITFINRTAGDMYISWLDFQGGKIPYATVNPGGTYKQQTFEGHVWLVTDSGGKTIGVFEADADDSSAVIGEDRDAPKPLPGKKESRDNAAATSPDGRWNAFIRDHNVWVHELNADGDTVLSSDGAADDAYDGRFCWSPDSKKLIAIRVRKGEDRKVYLVESSPKDQLQPKLLSYDYPKPGDRIPCRKPHLFDVVAGKQIPVKDELFPEPWPWEEPEMRWTPDSEEFMFHYNQRGHQVLRILAINGATGAVRTVVDEQSKTFIDYSGKRFTHYIGDTGELIWMSERDGWNHLYLYDARAGRLKNQITKGEWVVRGVDRVDETGRKIWFRAGGVRPEQDPYYIHYCRINFDGTGLTILTEGDGTHSVEYSPDGRFLVDTWSRVDLPPVTGLRSSEDGKLVCELERADWADLLRTGWRAPERFVAKARDGATDIFGVIFRPSDFDVARKYPVIENIYAGPHDSFVPKAFKEVHSSQEMAELGFIVVRIDGMGTSNRSKSFHDICWKNLGDSGFPDRILWLKAAAEKYPYMDLSRVGIYGGSAGGQSALRALLAYGDFYKVAVADCGCHDNRMDKIWWNEQWMGWPIGPHYEEQSNVTQAHKLQGKLLLIVGELDHNVDPSSTMQVVNALVKADKDFDLLVIPGHDHGAAETPYGKRRRADFFVRHLIGAEPKEYRERIVPAKSAVY